MPENKTSSDPDLSATQFFNEFVAERSEILKHKWLLSEEAGTDVGFEMALTDWVLNHRSEWLQSRRKTPSPTE